MSEGIRNYELYELGWTFNVAQFEPKHLKKLLPANRAVMPATGPLKPTKGKTAKQSG